jgi:methylenetetrahydrofolate dehydrogenase (NADP+) / methenyltetrahydrofolate cyclohydrolase
MPKILDGKVVRDQIMLELKEKISDFKIVPARPSGAGGPNLAIIKIGDNPDSDIYVKNKINFAKKIGVNAYVVDLLPRPDLSADLRSGLGDDITQEMLLAGIEKLNNDPDVHGIIVQSPLPSPLNWAEAVERVAPEKDVDGLCSVNVKKLLDNDKTALVPATARGVLALLKYYDIPVKGKKVVVMGRSNLVGKPIATVMMNNGAMVTVVHSQTLEPEKITREADILIVAIGKPEYVGAEFVKEGAVVIDVGISTVINSDGTLNRPRHQNDTPSLQDLYTSRTECSKSCDLGPNPNLTSSNEGISSKPLVTVVGDIDFDSVSPLVSAISPVPGGVGPMTVASLFENLVEVVCLVLK